MWDVDVVTLDIGRPQGRGSNQLMGGSFGKLRQHWKRRERCKNNTATLSPTPKHSTKKKRHDKKYLNFEKESTGTAGNKNRQESHADSAHGRTMYASPCETAWGRPRGGPTARPHSTSACTFTPHLVLVSPICTASVLNVRVRGPAAGRVGEGECECF